YVTAISDTGAAYKAGILQGDIITKIDGKEVKQVSAIREIVNSKRVGTTIEVTLQRNNGKEYEEKTVKVTLSTKDTLDGLSDGDVGQQDEEQNQDGGQPGGDGYQVIPWGFGN
ncbi:MAG: PDZ domain-containing protein, partial [Eubacterium sp.]|nr:PDZ domain-containing protein [Eubacterium sp.]